MGLYTVPLNVTASVHQLPTALPPTACPGCEGGLNLHQGDAGDLDEGNPGDADRLLGVCTDCRALWIMAIEDQIAVQLDPIALVGAARDRLRALSRVCEAGPIYPAPHVLRPSPVYAPARRDEPDGA